VAAAIEVSSSRRLSLLDQEALAQALSHSSNLDTSFSHMNRAFRNTSELGIPHITDGMLHALNGTNWAAHARDAFKPFTNEPGLEDQYLAIATATSSTSVSIPVCGTDTAAEKCCTLYADLPSLRIS
jgi:hypothetical protein